MPLLADVFPELTVLAGPLRWVIVAAVLGFNFLGDGLRDAADPYAND